MSTISDPNAQPTAPSGGNPFPNPDPNKNVDPFNQGPSVYLYGFLATLVLIFLVSIGVAWKGYHTRRILRARIDEAIARGVLIPGYDPSNPDLPLFTTTTFNSRLRNAPAPPRPIMYEGWIDAPHRAGMSGEKEWDIKPTTVTTLRQYDPTPPPPPPAPPTSHANSLLDQLLDPFRKYWFVTPPLGADANQLQGRPARTRGRGRGQPWVLAQAEEEERQRKEAEEREKEGDIRALKGVDEVVASVLIAMPDQRRHAAHAAVASGSRPTSSSSAYPYLQARPYDAMTSGGSAGGEEQKEELPALMLGVVQVGVVVPEEERKGAERAGEESKGKAVEVPSSSVPREGTEERQQ